MLVSVQKMYMVSPVPSGGGIFRSGRYAWPLGTTGYLCARGTIFTVKSILFRNIGGGGVGGGLNYF